MVEILALVLAVMLLLASLVLRALAGVVLPRIALRWLPEREAPAPWADLYAAAGAELAALGFDGGRWVLIEFDPKEAAAYPLMRWYRHGTDGSSAIVAPPVDLAAPNRPLVSFQTHFADGRQLLTTAQQPLLALLGSASVQRQDVAAADLAAQYRAHQSARAALGTAVDPQALDPAWQSREGVARYHAHLEELVAAGKAARDGAGRLRLSLGTLLAAFGVLLKRPRAGPPTAASAVPPARLAALFRLHDLARLRAPAPAIQWLLFGVSALLFALLGALLWNLAFALALLLVIAFHEAGHWLAMRALGYRNLQVLMMPLLGGIALGVEHRPSATRRAIVSLMGPLPGIVLGWALLLLASRGAWLAGDGFAAEIAGHLPLLLLVLNYLNLLPIPPLDGGHFVRALLPRQWSRVELGFLVLSMLLGVALAWYLESVLLALLVLLQGVALRTHLREGRAARELAAATPGYAALGEAEQRRLALERWLPRATPGLPVAKLLAQADTVRELAATVPPAAAARAGLLSSYALLFALPLALALPWLDDLLALGTSARQASALAAARDAARSELAGRPIDELALELARLVGDAAAAEPPDARAPEALAAAERRLGIELDADTRALLALGEAARLGFAPPAQWRRVDADDSLVLTEVRQAAVPVWRAADGALVEYDPGALAHWIVLGTFDEQMALLWNPDPAGTPRLIDYLIESPTGYDSTRQWLELRLADARAVRTLLEARQRVPAR